MQAAAHECRAAQQLPAEEVVLQQGNHLQLPLLIVQAAALLTESRQPQVAAELKQLPEAQALLPHQPVKHKQHGLPIREQAPEAREQIQIRIEERLQDRSLPKATDQTLAEQTIAPLHKEAQVM